MAGYLDQIPKQLAARRKAFVAARSNPALLPSCWAIIRSISNNIHEYVRNTVIGGCTFPDRPIYLSVEDAAFINLGATPRLLAQDAAWLEAEAAGSPPADPSLVPEISERGRIRVRRRLARLAAAYSPGGAADRVYSLEPWLQDMYRDRLDVDFAEHLQRQIDDLEAYMGGIPKSLQAAGLDGKLLKAVVNAFRLFKTITGSSHQIDREKMSFVDRRAYVDTLQKIELIMTKADSALGSAVSGRSAVRELFTLWKNANYEMMALTRSLRVLWAGTSLDDRIEELSAILGAVQKASGRCSEESVEPVPQLPAARADDANPHPITRSDVAEALRTMVLHDPVLGAASGLAAREIRKFGPLVALLAPGSGAPRYCREIRNLGEDDDEEKARRGKGKPAKGASDGERDIDVDRRVRYPLNCLVTPVGASRATLLFDMADAWLEYNQAAFPLQYKELMDGAREVCPRAFVQPEERATRDITAGHARRALAVLAAAFAEWARSGKEPDGDDAPDFAAFRDLALARLGEPDFLMPLRHRPFLHLFSESGPGRRLGMWKRCLGPRFALDRQLAAIRLLQKDWIGLEDSLKCLPASQVRGNSNIENGFAKTRDAGDPFASHKAQAFFRKFMEEQPELKSALATIESQVAIEVETLRGQSESLGRVFQYDQAASDMMRRQASQIQQRRNAANAHIDQYLVGLMHALDGNCHAAEVALAMCLTPLEKRYSEPPPPFVPEEIGEEWFSAAFRPKDGKFPKRQAPGEDSPGVVCHDYVYFNLGVVYLRNSRFIEAMMCFRSVMKGGAGKASHLCLKWAEKLFAAAEAKLAKT